MPWVIVLQRKCGFYPRPIHMRFMVEKVEMPRVPPRVLSFNAVSSTPPTLSTDIPFMSCQLHVTVSDVTAINPTPLSVVRSIVTKPTALSISCLNPKVCFAAYKFLHRLEFTHTSYYGSTTLYAEFWPSQPIPSSSILDKGLPIWHFQLLYIFSNITLPAYLWSSYWPSWSEFPGVYCLDHSCFLHPFDVTKPSQSLCSNKVYYVLMFYYFIQFLVGFYSPNTIFVGWAKYFPCTVLININIEGASPTCFGTSVPSSGRKTRQF